MIHEEAIRRAEERVAALPADTPEDARFGIRHSEINFWGNPHGVYHGGLPLILMYAEGEEWASIIDVPEDCDGQDLLRLMWQLGQNNNPKMLLYSATSRSGCLLVVVMTRVAMYKCRCPILQYRGRYDLGVWNIETHRNPEEEV